MGILGFFTHSFLNELGIRFLSVMVVGWGGGVDALFECVYI